MERNRIGCCGSSMMGWDLSSGVRRWHQFADRLQSRIFAYFIPVTEVGDRRSVQQARVFIFSHLIGPVISSSAVVALYIYDPTPKYDLVVLGLSITVFWIFPFLLRAGISLSVLILASLAVVHFGIFWSCYFYDGTSSPTMVWMLIVPILGACYLAGDKHLQPYLIALSLLSVLIFLALYHATDPPPNDIPSSALLGIGFVNTVAVLFYVGFMAVYYSRIFDAGVELEMEVRRRRSLADRLRAATAEADKAGALKSNFLARMSHELRSPLHSIIGYGQLVKEDALEKGDAQFLRDTNRILVAGAYLIRLIDMILDLSKLEAGRMVLDIQRQSVPNIIHNVVERYRSEIESDGNKIELQFAPDLKAVLWDANRVCEILGCLIANAGQHTQDGVIGISAGWDDRACTMIRMVVSDTGCGMQSDLLSALFRTFPIKDECAEQMKGTGLHLAVVGRLCAAMGGKITARSVMGRGSSFTVTLPVQLDVAAGSIE